MNSEGGPLGTQARGEASNHKEVLSTSCRVVTGNAVSVSIIESIAILGIDVTRSRLRKAISVLGGISKKSAKSLEKEFKGLC